MTRPAFDYSLDFRVIDFRKKPELYRIGKGETNAPPFNNLCHVQLFFRGNATGKAGRKFKFCAGITD